MVFWWKKILQWARQWVGAGTEVCVLSVDSDVIRYVPVQSPVRAGKKFKVPNLMALPKSDLNVRRPC